MDFFNSEHLVRFLIIILGIVFAVILGRFRPEWKSRKTLISWVWTIVAVDIIIMDGEFAMSFTAQMFIAGALILNIINFIGDRIETIKYKDFSASLGHEEENEKKHSINKEKPVKEDNRCPDRPEPTPPPPQVRKR